MTAYSVVLAVTAVLAVGSYLWFYLAYLPRLRSVTQKYPLFAVRDELVALKLAGKFDQDPALYDMLCGITNNLIVHTKKLDFKIFLTSLSYLEAECDTQSAYWERIRSAPREVREIEDRLWWVVLQILYQNSTLLRILRSAFHLMRRIAALPAPVGESAVIAPVKHYVRITSTRKAALA